MLAYLMLFYSGVFCPSNIVKSVSMAYLSLFLHRHSHFSDGGNALSQMIRLHFSRLMKLLSGKFFPHFCFDSTQGRCFLLFGFKLS